jgi:GAF domain-containing protein
MRDGRSIGTIAVGRSRPFSDKHIALLQTFADQAVIAIENVRLFNETKEALERQTATAEVLRVISQSPTDVQPVFEAITAAATRLCAAQDSGVVRFDGALVHVMANDGFTAEERDAIRAAFPRPADRTTVTGRAILTRAVAHVPDITCDPDYDASSIQRGKFMRAVASVPMLRDGQPIGAITVTRREAVAFGDAQIALLKTFADQAVIAIENVRLVTELQDKNRALTGAHAQISEALERQTATADILSAISRSPTDVQPVFDAIVASAARLCDADSSAVVSFDGELMRLEATRNWTPELDAAVRRNLPSPPTRAFSLGRAIRERTVIHLPDVECDAEYMPELIRAGRFRSILTVPMLRDGVSLGAITVGRRRPGPFADNQIALLKTFGDQAVIAIENVRLFKELEARNSDLTDALARQTATSEILRVISSSPTNVQPVFDAIVESAVRLCGGVFSSVYTFDGELIHLVATHNWTPAALEVARRIWPTRPSREVVSSRAILERRVVHVPDVVGEYRKPELQELIRSIGYRSILATPMLRGDVPLGAIAVARTQPGEFPDNQVELLKTFADQAVIAIENARLFKELQARTQELIRSVGQLTALGEVGRAVSSTLDLETVLTTIVGRAVELSGTSGGVIYEHDDATDEFRLRASHQIETELVELLRDAPFRLGEGVTGRAAALRRPVQVMDLLTEREFALARISPIAEGLGYRSVLAVPLLLEDRAMGGLTVWRKQPGDFAPDVVHLLQTFAAQSSLALQNARLFREIEDKSRQLEIASLHKSQFLASMSHELRTPLNGILGFTEMILDNVYGDVPPELGEPLTEIQNSGRHLLGLINNVLDLSKIEAGRMELALGDYAVQDTVAQVRASLQSLAAAKGLEFVTAVPTDMPLAHGDVGRITQCLTNLAGNAIKFTRQGRVEIAVEPQGELLVYRVSDTGIGIEPDRISTLFTEFRQADPTIASEFGGSGLGLSITRKFAEMHGGRVWVESERGKGSSFFLAVPLRLRG